METKEKEVKAVMQREGLIEGIWQLKYALVNDLGAEGFSGRMIGSYPDAVTGRERRLFDVNGQERAGFLIEKQVTNLDARNPFHRLIIDWLIGHPEVGVAEEQTKVDDRYYIRKLSNPRITLVNLDHQSVVDFEEQDYIDKLVGKIAEDTGKQAFSRDKLRFLLSAVKLDYRDERLITKPELEIVKLRGRLKNYVRSSYANAKEVNRVIDNIEDAKYIYEIKELARTGIISMNDGMYRYKGNGLGISYESIITFFKNDPEFYAELSSKLYEALKRELN